MLASDLIKRTNRGPVHTSTPRYTVHKNLPQGAILGVFCHIRRSERRWLSSTLPTLTGVLKKCHPTTPPHPPIDAQPAPVTPRCSLVMGSSLCFPAFWLGGFRELRHTVRLANLQISGQQFNPSILHPPAAVRAAVGGHAINVDVCVFFDMAFLESAGPCAEGETRLGVS